MDETVRLTKFKENDRAADMINLALLVPPMKDWRYRPENG